MKFLIWFGCFFVTALVQTLFGMKLGGIPTAMFFGATFAIAKNFSLRYENRQNKASRVYAETTKGLMKGFTWYGCSILYVILGTIAIASNPTSFDVGSQIFVAVLCIGLAIGGHLLINKKVNPAYSKEQNVVSDEEAFNTTPKIQFCRKCGEHLDDGSRFCRKCGTEIKEEV